MSTNQRAAPGATDTAAIQRAIDAFEHLQHRLMEVHAPEFTALELTMAQAKLLYVLAVGRDLTLSETAARLHVSMSTASVAVDHLVARALVARREDPDDRRQLRISLTSAGADALEQLRELGIRPLRSLFKAIDPAQLAVIEQAIQILDDAVTVAWPAGVATTEDQGSPAR